LPFAAALSLIYGCGLFFSYFLSSWAAALRYFAPSLAALTVSFALLYPEVRRTFSRRAITRTFTVLLIISAVYVAQGTSVSFIPKDPTEPYWVEVETKIRTAREKGCLPTLGVSDGYTYGVDFVTNYAPLEYIRAKYGLTPCPASGNR